MAKKQPWAVLPKLTEAEQSLIWHMEHGYQLETDSLGGDPVLRRLKNDERSLFSVSEPVWINVDRNVRLHT